MKYIRSKKLGGVMFWELSNDTDNGELIERSIPTADVA